MAGGWDEDLPATASNTVAKRVRGAAVVSASDVSDSPMETLGEETRRASCWLSRGWGIVLQGRGAAIGVESSLCRAV